MRARLSVILLCLSCLIPSLARAASPRAAPAPEPVAPDSEARRAFDDLGRYYADQDSVPPYDLALEALASTSPPERQAAGRYLLRLFQQSLADETNGRAEWMQMPSWGGEEWCHAREFREELAEAFGQGATGEEALPALEWLLQQEPVPEIQATGASALGLVHGPLAVELLGRLMREPHPSGAVLLDAIEAARAQSLVSLIPELRGLSLHYRESVRRAASEALAAMGAGKPPKWRPKAAFPRWLAQELQTCAARVWTPIPRTARWKLFYLESDRLFQGHPCVRRIRGWLLAEEDTTYRLLDEFGQEVRLPHRRTRPVPQTLAEDAARMVELRLDDHLRERDVAESLSYGGALTGQFESPDLSLPEILVAAWSLERGDTATASKLLFPRLDALGHDHLLNLIARDLLGNIYHRKMLEAFSYDRDYARAMALAEHLSRPLFDGYFYQPRARELRAQLALRRTDFTSFSLPESMQWERRRSELDRPSQIAYLCERLRLLNSFQCGQPFGAPDLCADQYEEPTHQRDPWDGTKNRSRRLVNPYRELAGMGLTPADLPSLAPALADVRFLPTFGFWRDFHPARDLYRVCAAAAELINETAQRELIDPDSIPDLTPDQRDEMVRAVSEWGRARAGMSPQDLRIEVLKTTRSGYEFRTAAEEGLDDGDPRVPPAMLARIDEFPHELVWLLRICARAKTDAFVALARKRVDVPADTAEGGWDRAARIFYSGLILLRHGEPKGLDALRGVVAKDTDGTWMREAFGELLATKDSVARALLCGGARTPKVLLDDHNSALLRRLFREGCEGIADSLLARLDSDQPAGKIYSANDRTGEMVERDLVPGDTVADYLADWRPGGQPYDKLAPDEQRARRRREIRLWLVEQAHRVRAGEPLDMYP